MRPVLSTLDKDKVLNTTPHYTDDRFRIEQTVFGEQSKTRYGHKGLIYVYSDRLWEWDYEKSKEASSMATGKNIKHKTCRWYEAYLSAYFGQKIEIDHIIAGVNHSNGYPYCVFGYRVIDNGT